MDPPPYPVIPRSKQCEESPTLRLNDTGNIDSNDNKEFSANNLFTNSPVQIIGKAAILHFEQHPEFRPSVIQMKAGGFGTPLSFSGMNNSMKILAKFEIVSGHVFWDQDMSLIEKWESKNLLGLSL
jgi:hypothetical protein